MLKRDIQPYIPDLKARLITNREVARLLNVTEAHLSRTLKDLEIAKEPAKNHRQQQKQLTKTRKEHRLSLSKRLPPEEAAKAANCSIRTIYRYRNGKL
jgi:transcriptional regulator with XRE-family HTH domain